MCTSHVPHTQLRGEFAFEVQNLKHSTIATETVVGIQQGDSVSHRELGFDIRRGKKYMYAICRSHGRGNLQELN